MGYYNSFVVRIWTNEQGRSRGHIEHVGSRDSLVFLAPEAIIDFIYAHLAPPAGGFEGEVWADEIGLSDDVPHD